MVPSTSVSSETLRLVLHMSDTGGTRPEGPLASGFSFPSFEAVQPKLSMPDGDGVVMLKLEGRGREEKKAYAKMLCKRVHGLVWHPETRCDARLHNTRNSRSCARFQSPLALSRATACLEQPLISKRSQRRWASWRAVCHGETNVMLTCQHHHTRVHLSSQKRLVGRVMGPISSGLRPLLSPVQSYTSPGPTPLRRDLTRPLSSKAAPSGRTTCNALLL